MTTEDELTRLRRLKRQLIDLLESRGIKWQTELDSVSHAQPVTTHAETHTSGPELTPTSHTPALTTPQKIALFRSLFRGRTDVYPIRWENNAGRSGYSPACHNEWKSGVCGKPTIKCSQCSNQAWKSVTDKVIYDHLAGKHVIGIYPMMADDQCHFLAVDFDEGNWQADADSFRQSCEQLTIPCAIEISRSGNGAHAWIFFSEPVLAKQARNLGTAIISYTCAGAGPNSRQLKLSSYDRMFPNQDTLPKVSWLGSGASDHPSTDTGNKSATSFGNLIALPLQKHPRAQGHSVFVDHDFVPYPDQWAYLASIKPLSIPDRITEKNSDDGGGDDGGNADNLSERLAARPTQAMASTLTEHINNLIQQAVGSKNALDVGHFTLEAFDPDAPWQQQTALETTGSGSSPTNLPANSANRTTTTITLTLSNLIYLPKAELSPQLTNRLIRIAAFQNPEYYKAQALRLPVWNKPRIIACAENFPNHIGLPRGCLDAAISVLAEHNIQAKIQDERQSGRPLVETVESRILEASDQPPNRRTRQRNPHRAQASTAADEPIAARPATKPANEPAEVPTITFHGKLRHEQNKAVNAMLAHDHGVLCAPTAFGKTVTAAALIATRGVNTLILVHRTELLDQWKERLCGFLGLSENEVGMIGGGKATKRAVKAKKSHTEGNMSAAVSQVAETLIDIAMVQSLTRQGTINPIVEKYGHVIVDECHHVSAVSFEQILKAVKARYVLGLTATPIRRDGLQPIIMMQCGPIRHRASRAETTPTSLKVHAYEIAVAECVAAGCVDDLGAKAENTYPAADHTSQPIQTVFHTLAQDKVRTEFVVNHAMVQFRQGRKVLLLTERTDHLLTLQAMIHRTLAESVESALVLMLHGRMKKSERADVFQRLQSLAPDSPRILLATGRLIGEGFDHAPLDTLVMAMPISWKGTLQQYVGRLHREHANKTNILVIDFIDQSHPSLVRMWRKRQAGYKAMGYEIQKMNHGVNARAEIQDHNNNEDNNEDNNENDNKDTIKPSQNLSLKDQGRLNI